MKLLDLDGYLGPLCEDATDGFIEVYDEIGAIYEAASVQRMVLTADLQAVELTPEIADKMAEALANSPYMQAKVKAAELQVAPSIAERLAAEKGNNGKGGR